MGGAKVLRLHATAEHRREEAWELHAVPLRLVGVVAEASPAPGGVGRRGGVEAEGEGEGLVAGGAAAGGEGAGQGEELVEEVVIRVLRWLPGHARRRGAAAAGLAGVAAWDAGTESEGVRFLCRSSW